MKRAVLLLIPVILAVIIFVPIENRVLYWGLYVVIFALVYAYHVMEEVVPLPDIEKSLNCKDFFHIKCGYIKINGDRADLVKGLMVIYSGTVLFYVRATARGGVKLIQSVPGEQIETYVLCKVDDYHAGIQFELSGGQEMKFTGKKFAQNEAEIRKALGWPQEEKKEPEEG